MLGTLVECCARAASGHVAAAPPMSEMNSRRLRAGMGWGIIYLTSTMGSMR